MVKKQPRLFWIGLLLYVVSFFLVAFFDSLGEPTRGWWWAFAAVALPAGWRLTAVQHGHAFANAPLAYAAIAVGGLTNPAFVGAITIGLLTRRRLVFSALRIAVFAMIPFAWIALVDMLLIPREGYVLWVAGMLIALSTCTARTRVPDLDRLTA